MSPVKLVGRDEFARKLSSHGAAPEGLGVLKEGLALKSIDESNRTAEFIISDGLPDRDRDTIDVAGWDLRSYRQNPIVLFAHDSRSLPIGQATRVRREGDQLVATARFTGPDLNPMGDTVFRMIQQRYLRATSVGFRPTQFTPYSGDDPTRRGGINFERQELLEFSVVPIPSNPRALIQRTQDPLQALYALDAGEAIEVDDDLGERILADLARGREGLTFDRELERMIRRAEPLFGDTVTISDATAAEIRRDLARRKTDWRDNLARTFPPGFTSWRPHRR